jgi:hypothetical protein
MEMNDGRSDARCEDIEGCRISHSATPGTLEHKYATKHRTKNG